MGVWKMRKNDKMQFRREEKLKWKRWHLQIEIQAHIGADAEFLNDVVAGCIAARVLELLHSGIWSNK